MTENIQHIKLMNGEEIIGDVINISPTDIYIDNPMVLDEWVDQSSGQGGVVLNRFLPFAKENFIGINNNHILARYDVHEMVKKYYYQSVKYAEKSSTKMLTQLDVAADIMEKKMGSANDRYVHPGTGTTN